jgi:hypothetical protein
MARLLASAGPKLMQIKQLRVRDGFHVQRDAGHVRSGSDAPPAARQVEPPAVARRRAAPPDRRAQRAAVQPEPGLWPVAAGAFAAGAARWLVRFWSAAAGSSPGATVVMVTAVVLAVLGLVGEHMSRALRRPA